MCAQNPVKILSDTVNRTNAEGKKYGFWQKCGSDITYQLCFKPDQVVEEGVYVDGRKNGLWREYYCNGKYKNKITFVDGRPNGEGVCFYENGNVSEIGYWKKNRWVGKYLQYFEDGTVQHEFYFDTLGKKTLMYYYQYNNGKKDTAMIYKEGRYIDPKSGEPLKNTIPFSDDWYAEPMNLPYGEKTLEGQHTLYNKHRQITKEGIFKGNQLYEGKSYIYDSEGRLFRIMLYKEGKYVGDGGPLQK